MLQIILYKTVEYEPTNTQLVTSCQFFETAFTVYVHVHDSDIHMKKNSNAVNGKTLILLLLLYNDFRLVYRFGNLYAIT
jgi:hypothetical protein